MGATPSSTAAVSSSAARSTVLASNAASAVVASNTAASYCSSAPYNQLLMLRSLPSALSYCSSKYPIATPTCTAFSTSIVTIIVNQTTTVPSTTQVLISTTGLPANLTITQSLPGATIVSTEVDTVTVTTTTIRNNKRGMDEGRPNPTTCSAALDRLKSSAATFIGSACSCIETTPACTTSTSVLTTSTTLTSTATSYVTTSTTSYVSNTEINTISTSITLPPTSTTTTTVQTTTATAVQCPARLTLCGGSCKNLQTDANNCGACGNTCSTGKCSAGTCQACTPGVCGDVKSCLTGACTCNKFPDGTSGCAEVASCSNSCKSDNDCSDPATMVCITNTCCNDGSNCKPRANFNSCANPSNAKRMFNYVPRGAALIQYEDGSLGPAL